MAVEARDAVASVLAAAEIETFLTAALFAFVAL
jgi:hypothetical protein